MAYQSYVFWVVLAMVAPLGFKVLGLSVVTLATPFAALGFWRWGPTVFWVLVLAPGSLLTLAALASMAFRALFGA